MNKGPGYFAKKPLAVSVASAILALASTQASAVNFDVGDFQVSFDSTFSLGAAWRVEDRNFDLIGKSNNPSFDWSNYNPALGAAYQNTPLYLSAQKYSSADVWNTPTGSYSNNGDAGNLNWDSGSAFSQIFKGLHELSINKEDYGSVMSNYGLFTRFMYFYDFKMKNGGGSYVNPTSGKELDPCRDSDASDLSCSDIRLLDAFVYADFDFNDGETPVSVRIGNQVLSWGESTLISHGININPVDIARLRAPGAELKEAFIPVGMVWASVGITENISAEFFYQYDWQETYLPTPGSYFSTNDFAGEGGYLNNIQLGFTANPDIDLDFLIERLNGLQGDWMTAMATLGVDPSSPQAQQLLTKMYMTYPTKVTLRPQDDLQVAGFDQYGVNEPKDSGQYGAKLALFAPQLNDTEFGLYYVNYHSRRPVISGISADFRLPALQHDLQMLTTKEITKDNVTELKAFSKGVLEYPEDIKLYGLSFNTTIGETAVSGELAYRQDEPLQIDDVEILYAGMPEQLANAGLRPDLAGISQVDGIGSGQYAKGYILSDTTQLQFTFAHLFGPTLGSDNFAVVAEVGGVTINDMPAFDELRLNGPNTARTAALDTGVAGLHTGLSNGAETNPFPTKNSWGYRLIAKADYNNVFAGVNVSPKIVFAHDVSGITPDPLYLFVEDRKSVGVSINFDYQSKISADFSYNSFWGGQGTTNNFADRDYVSFSIKYSI
ncbi:DUF1302 domain-containing protein [Flocculibacter collagenilyticus]|uniref:DUF1302 domain-containing protein n=1 Tax=Flocculibacter collagenilyticus TaxID=2744479 RepID=UPI0018F5BDBD|nr:DUF1302 domain-containing protein [Flocculibacter collagenilyticus]